MDVAEVRELLSPETLRLLDEIGPVDRSADIVAAVSGLRAAGNPPAAVATALTQARLRARAADKFGPFAARMLFTEEGLEQATRLRVAALHAGRFAAAGLDRVADLGCGIGADSLALAGLGLEVLAVDRDEATAAIAAYNLAPFERAEVRVADAADIDLTDRDGVWLDPARRDAAGRRRDPVAWSPSLEFCLRTAEQQPTGIKLGPGVDRDLIPDGMEAQWVSVDRDVVELTLWSGPLARAGARRSALVLRADGMAELAADDDARDAPVGELGGWLYEPDGAVIRARQIGRLADELSGRMLDGSIAWITADERSETPFAQRFRVVAEFPLDLGRLRKELRARRIGRIEIKKRGVDLNPADVRRTLALRGDGSATLVLTRRAGRRVAILAERD